MAVDAKEIVKVVADVAKPIAETLGDTWNAIIGDRVASYRLRNAAKLQPKVVAQLDALGLKMNPAKIPERYAIAWFEEATKQDEPEIQDLFARLLAKAAAGDEDALDRRLLDIVTRLTPLDASIFSFIFDFSTASNNVDGENMTVTRLEILETELSYEVRERYSEKAWLCVEHLTALGVLERTQIIDEDSVYDALMLVTRDRKGRIIVAPKASLELQVISYVASTGLGMSLYRALHRSSSQTG